MPEVQTLTVKIEETIWGFHLVEADGPAMGPCFATGRTSQDAFGRACYAATFGEFPDAKWEAGEKYESPYAFGLKRDEVISEMRYAERAATLAVRGVEPYLAMLASEIITTFYEKEKEFPAIEVTRHYVAYVGGWEDDDPCTRKLEMEVARAGWAGIK